MVGSWGLFDDAQPEFRERGYAVRPFLDADEIAAIAALYDSLPPDTGDEFYVTIYSRSPEYRRRISEGIRSVVEGKLEQRLPGYKMWLGAFAVKRPACPQASVPLHHDWWIVDNRIHTAVHVWCPLIDVDVKNSCLKVVPGSHRLRATPYPINPLYRTEYHPVLNDIDRTFSKRVAMPAGSALIYNQRLLHGSDGNPSDHARVAFNCIMAPEGVPPRVYRWNDRVPDRMEALEIEEDYLFEFICGDPIEPANFRLLESFPIEISALADEELAPLREAAE